MKRFSKYFRPLLLVCLSLLLSSLISATEIKVSGTVTKLSGEYVPALTVSLIQISMDNPPVMETLAESVTDQLGQFHFAVGLKSPPGERTFYRVSVLYDGQPFGSNPFRLDVANPFNIVDIQLPPILEGSHHLQFVKEVVILESSPSALRVTDIVFVDNNTGAMVNAKKSPFEKKLPEGAMNIHLIDQSEGQQIEVSENLVKVRFAVPGASSRIVLGYDIPIDGGELSFDLTIPTELKLIEVTTPEKGLEVQLNEAQYLKEGKTYEEKTVGGRKYFSHLINPKSDQAVLSIKISGFPVSQKNLILSAIVLFIALFGGLFWFLKSRQN